jgi:hypothetical protein
VAKDTFRLQHKQSGFITDPITEEQAKDIAGYPGDYEKLDEVKPSRAGYDTDQHGEPKTKRSSRTASKPRSGASRSPARRSTASTSAPTPAPAAPAEGAAKEG